MTYHIVIFNEDGTVGIAQSKTKPDYAAIKKVVGGLIERIPYFTKLDLSFIPDAPLMPVISFGEAFANEEGIMLNFAFNRTATAAWQHACPTGNFTRMRLFGPVIFFGKERK